MAASTGEDALQVLEIFVNDVANLPAEIAHIYEEIGHKDVLLRAAVDTARARERALHAHYRAHGALEPHPKESTYVEQYRKCMRTARDLEEEKLALAEKAVALLDRHVRRLDAKIAELVHDGAMQPFAVVPPPSNLPVRLAGPAAAAQGAAGGVGAAVVRAASAGGREGTPGSAAAAAAAAAAANAFRRPARERKKREDAGGREEEEGTDDKRLYCTCREVSYGSMVGCDDRDCPFEWFHWGCVGLTEEPVGQWYCPPCVERRAKIKAARG